MRSFFITGTDTGVGKTALTSVLLAAAREAGIDAVPMKPVQTGVRRAMAARAGGDMAVAIRAASWQPRPGEVPLLGPYRYPRACSPHLAASLAGRPLRVQRIVRSHRELAGRHDAVLVEGAGGALVPLAGRQTMLDLMASLGLPILVAARPGLGTLNHAMLTCGAIRARGLEIAGVVLVQAARGRWTALMQDNLETLRRFGVPVLGRLPHMPGFALDPRAACLRALRRPETRWIGPLLRA